MMMRESVIQQHTGLKLAARCLATMILITASCVRAQEQQLLDVVNGERYETEAPDTLDLAERAKAAVGVMTANRQYSWGKLTHKGSKWSEAMPLLRLMSGSELNLARDREALDYMLDSMPKATTHGLMLSGRSLRALSYYYQISRDPPIAKAAAEVLDFFEKNAIYHERYAFYPRSESYKGGDPFQAVQDRRYMTLEPPKPFELEPPYRSDPNFRADPAQGVDDDGAWYDSRFGVPMYYSAIMEGLFSWIKAGRSGLPVPGSVGQRSRLTFLSQLAAFTVKPEYWSMPGEPNAIRGSSQGHYLGHTHAHVALLRAILNYAVEANDTGLKQFVRDGYEYTRGFGAAEIGYIPEWTDNNRCETCEVSDMIALAIRLTDAGVGDYWEDVDQYTRNQFAEQQIMNPDNPMKPDVGYFTSTGYPTYLFATVAGCCTDNGSQGLYYAWDAIVRSQGTHANINLLLNRAHALLDIDSHLPYEGKVVIQNKGATSISVRIPPWVDRSALSVSMDDHDAPFVWVGHYISIRDMKKGDRVVIEFPMALRIESLRVMNDETVYTYEFKGNTVVGVSPRPPISEGHMAIYQRDQYKRDKAPTVKVTRFIAPQLIDW